MPSLPHTEAVVNPCFMMVRHRDTLTGAWACVQMRDGRMVRLEEHGMEFTDDEAIDILQGMTREETIAAVRAFAQLRPHRAEELLNLIRKHDACQSQAS